MMMLFSAGVKMLPMESLIPFNETDVMYMMSQSIGFRLCNLITDDGDKFLLGKVMESAEVFHCKAFADRLKDFESIKDTRLERFFVTQKSPYLFFDKEEQEYLKKSFQIGFNCSVEIYVRSVNGNMEKTDLFSLPNVAQRQTMMALKKLKVREVLTISEAWNLQKAKPNKNPIVRMDQMQDFFEAYPKLKDISTRLQLARYRKYLVKKYHPDISEEQNCEEISVQINQDFDILVKTSWYSKLSDDKEVG